MTETQTAPAGARTQQERRRPKLFFLGLINAATEAADWMCEAPEGTDQYERGIALRKAIKQATKGGN